jgi:hypothetical protein
MGKRWIGCVRAVRAGTGGGKIFGMNPAWLNSLLGQGSWICWVTVLLTRAGGHEWVCACR